MQLQKLNYSQFKDRPQAWEIADFTFGPINLIVGMNASGKTRTLNVIRGLSELLTQAKLKFSEGKYDVELVHDGSTVRYSIDYRDQIVLTERLQIDSNTYFDRGKEGEGKIRAEKLNQMIDFQTPTDQVAALSRRDSLQHPFLENLYSWASNFIRYDFGTPLGKDLLRFSTELAASDKINLKETNKVIPVLIRGLNDYDKKFHRMLIDDMARIGYDVEKIGVEPIEGIELDGMPQANGVFVKEKALRANVNQHEISQGMFRALSLIIQINYAYLAGHPSCILIDDIGEGLDYGRAAALITLLTEKAERFSSQLIMTSNDRFVMNNFPLQNWIILSRENGKLRAYDYRNSQQMFDDFALTGLSNFDFLSSKYFLKPEKRK